MYLHDCPYIANINPLIKDRRNDTINREKILKLQQKLLIFKKKTVFVFGFVN